MTADIEQVTSPLAEHGEGPVWDADAGILGWVDMLRGDLLRLARDGTVTRVHVSDVAAAWRPRRSGGWVLAVERGFALVDRDGSVERLPDLWTDPSVRMNDGGCDLQGRFYCGSTAVDGRSSAGTIFRLDAGHTAREVLTGASVSNGLAWSPDGALAYYVDTPTRRVDVLGFDSTDGTFTNRRALATVPDGPGLPDGITIDAEGGVWVALWNGGAVLRYLPDGRLDQRIPVPVTNATACTFGGDLLDTLYITTSARDVLREDEPEAGAIFAVRPGVRGLPANAYAG